MGDRQVAVKEAVRMAGFTGCIDKIAVMIRSPIRRQLLSLLTRHRIRAGVEIRKKEK